MTRYKEYLLKMINENKEIFDKFKILHDDYSLNPDKMQNAFNNEGEKILEIIRDYENRLCANQERGMYNKFSANLAEKFQKEVKKVYPLIDHIGLKVINFSIKKITLV